MLADSFDLIRVQAGIVGKEGRPATISGRGNMKGTMTEPGHMTLAINMTRRPVVAPVLGRLSGHRLNRPVQVGDAMS